MSDFTLYRFVSYGVGVVPLSERTTSERFLRCVAANGCDAANGHVATNGYIAAGECVAASGCLAAHGCIAYKLIEVKTYKHMSIIHRSQMGAGNG